MSLSFSSLCAFRTWSATLSNPGRFSTRRTAGSMSDGKDDNAGAEGSRNTLWLTSNATRRASF